jgi:hypothetical protein
MKVDSANRCYWLDSIRTWDLNNDGNRSKQGEASRVPSASGNWTKLEQPKSWMMYNDNSQYDYRESVLVVRAKLY